jgi:hypothetical protein
MKTMFIIVFLLSVFIAMLFFLPFTFNVDPFSSLTLSSQVKLGFIVIILLLILYFYYENLNKQYKNKLLEANPMKRVGT